MSTVCLIVVCKGRLAEFKQSLPTMVAQPDASVVVVDAGGADGGGDWVEREYPAIRVVRAKGGQASVAHGRNLGAAAAEAAWLCFLEPGMALHADFWRAMSLLAADGRYCRPRPPLGALVCANADFRRCGGYDALIDDSVIADTDLQQRLQMAGISPQDFPAHLLSPVAAFPAEQELPDRGDGVALELYVRAKTDMMKLTGALVSEEVRRALLTESRRAMSGAAAGGQGGKLEIGLGPQAFVGGRWTLEPRLSLALKPASAPVPSVGQRPPMPFIIGSGRCGTTLLRMMLDCHPQLAIPYETHFIPQLAAAWRTAPNPAALAWARMVGDPRWPSYGIDAQALKDAIGHLPQPSLGDVLRTFFDLCGQRFAKPRVGDKTAMYIWDMATIAEALPEACFIHVIRDGRDVALSYRGLWWGPQTVPAAAAWWASAIETARQFPRRERYLELRYEDLVRDPEPILRRVCAFIDLPWSPAMLDFSASAPDRLGDIGDMPIIDGRVIPADRIRAIHAKTQGGLDASGIGRWRREMTEEEVSQFGIVAGPLLSDLGYDAG